MLVLNTRRDERLIQSIRFVWFLFKHLPFGVVVIHISFWILYETVSTYQYKLT